MVRFKSRRSRGLNLNLEFAILRFVPFGVVELIENPRSGQLGLMAGIGSPNTGI